MARETIVVPFLEDALDEMSKKPEAHDLRFIALRKEQKWRYEFLQAMRATLTTKGREIPISDSTKDYRTDYVALRSRSREVNLRLDGWWDNDLYLSPENYEAYGKIRTTISIQVSPHYPTDKPLFHVDNDSQYNWLGKDMTEAEMEWAKLLQQIIDGSLPWKELNHSFRNHLDIGPDAPFPSDNQVDLLLGRRDLPILAVRGATQDK